MRKELLKPESAFVAQVREKTPDATEAEIYLLERLIGALGMVRRLMTHGEYMIERENAYDVVNEFMLKRYGWKLKWRDEV